jgi:hypothetical protein
VNAAELNKRLRELIIIITQTDLNEKKYTELTSSIRCAETQSDYTKIDMEKVEKSLDDLQICIKYMVFDLEATRRECGMLIKRLQRDDDTPDISDGNI